MTDLSPAADAVLDAYMNNCGWLDGPLEKDYRCAAAVVRAAADRVVPKTPTLSYPEDYELGVWVANDDTRTEFLAIAAELEAHQ